VRFLKEELKDEEKGERQESPEEKMPKKDRGGQEDEVPLSLTLSPSFSIASLARER